MPQDKPTIFISISIGWAVRNFFQTGIIGALKDRYRIVVFTTRAIQEALIRQGYGEGIEFQVMEQTKEPRRWRLFRQFKKKIYMESRRCSTEEIEEKYKPRPLYQRIGGRAVRLLIRCVRATTLLNAVESLDFRINRDAEMAAVFGRIRPLFFFATHASSIFEERLLRSAVRAGVPVTFMVLSWDHLSSKVVLSRRFDRIFVWNKITKRELLETYPNYREDQIRVVGAPQFDVYTEKPRLSYAQWCENWGLDKARRTLLFTTAPHLRHEQQHVIIERLLQGIVEGRNLPSDLQIFIKCHPFDTTPEYDSFVEKYPVAVYRPAANLSEPQDNWIPSPDEMIITRDSLYYCSVNLNIFSTITLEAAFLDRPIIHIAFDPDPPKNRIPCREYYNFAHFKRVVDLDGALMVESFEELFGAVNSYLCDPDIKKEGRAMIVKTFFDIQKRSSSARVIQELLNHPDKSEGSLGARACPSP